MKNKIIYTLLLITISIFFYSCKNNNSGFFSGEHVFHFDNSDKDTISYKMDLDHEVFSTTVIPSQKKDSISYFLINFDNTDYKANRKYYYKVFYQNKSYKFKEFNKQDSNYNILSAENFYGSWENVDSTFKIINTNSNNFSVDSFRIIGNPRNEKKFYQSKPAQTIITQEKIDKFSSQIKNNPDWYAKIIKKAKKNNISTKEQLRLDAIWMIENENGKDIINNRWMRNPRVGDYEIMLVIVSENDLKKIPDYIKNISKKDGDVFINPFYYFLYGEGSKLKETKVLISNKTINISAQLNFKSGIYVDLTEFKKTNYNKEELNEKCDTSKEMFNNAQFEQFFHRINKNFPLNNIPIIKDVIGGYTKDEYNYNKDFYNDNQRIKENVQITDCPCKTAKYNSDKDVLEITVPGNSEKMRKENVGVRTRIGFTYGKYIAKIKFPKLINEDNVWDGLTNAFWLIYQDDAEWNYRRNCKGGYIPPSESWKTGVRANSSHYSEIDIEIVKASEFWPKTSYKNKVAPTDNPENNRDIIVACTNWDLACRDPKDFSIGAKKFKYNNKEYELHRWDDGYKAVTHKSVVSHDWLLGEYSYYEIDWQPDKIIWRVGKDLNNMKVICEMDDNVTSIPNNQMVIVVTQEFHDGDWWPTTPFHQNNIPFPAKDIKAEIEEIIIK